MARENSFYQDIFNYIVHGSFYPDATESKKNELLKEAIQYTVIQGNLYRTFPPACKKLRLVLSKQINQKIAICESHISNDDHLNVKETCLNVRKKYYWKNIENDVIEFIKQCPDCSEDNKSFPIKAKHQQYECLDRVWKLLTRTSGRMKRYSLRQSPKPNESLGFFNDYIRTSPIKRTSRSVNKKDFPPTKMRRLASKQDLIHSLVEKYCLKDTFVVLQPLPSKVVESALAGNVKVANPVLVNEKEVPAETAAHSLPTSSKEIDSAETNEANKENNENHSQPEQEVAVR
ncbi:uncharacterized protein [Centruroides vittatus]|uniref:uncharacterized protein isoform X2 n=1 Tax=Centruroides vittatus TaxID=120091 RepID=UPI0035109170